MHEDVVVFFNGMGHPFEIEVAGVSYCDGTYVIKRPKSMVTCMEYIIEGRGHVHYDNKSFVAEKGDVYILNAGHDHYYYSDAAEPWTKIWVNIRGEYATRIFNYFKIDNINHFKDCDIEHYFRDILRIAASKRDLSDILNDCNVVFVKMVQEIAKRFVLYKKPDSLAARLREMIDNDVSFSGSLDDYSEKLFCTKQYAITTFKEAYGITPYQYIISHKISTAENLLKNTTVSIAHISEMLNFCDSHYFSSFFKQHKGISPLQYRKQHMEL